MSGLRSFIGRARRVLRKPPAHIARRVLIEAGHELDRFTQPRFGQTFDTTALLRRARAGSVDELWDRLLACRMWPRAASLAAGDYASCCPGDEARIVDAAERAVRHEIDLLGSGPVSLGPKIDWHRDYKTHDRWPVKYFRTIDYVNRNRPSDVKTVWELSRLQWLLPCGQAYVLTGDERYAEAARAVLQGWIDANPYCCGVNWGVDMEPALRVVSWAWLMHALGASAAWRDQVFRAQLLRSLFLHALFVERYMERSDIRGNHFTAAAMALTVAGSIFGAGADAVRWLTTGLDDVEREIRLQVHSDGVDFEASTAYHRLVAEMFLTAAMAARAAGRAVSGEYRARLELMAQFTESYSRGDGSTPLWGDADDGRVLPLGGQSISDHRYLPGLIGLFLRDRGLIDAAQGARSEAAWLFGVQCAAGLGTKRSSVESRTFTGGGFYIMRAADDHVFVDCGPLGLAGRGGHDHNDMLSFEAALAGQLLVSDRGTCTYTGSFETRNEYRSTSSHNTPQIDGQEINRIPNPDWLWFLEHDARPTGVEFSSTPGAIRFVGGHDGYARLEGRPAPRRSITLQPGTHTLTVRDEFSGAGDHRVRIPLHLAPGVSVERQPDGLTILNSRGARFALGWNSGGGPWSFAVEPTAVSPSYGVTARSERLVWNANSAIRDLWLEIVIHPIKHST